LGTSARRLGRLAERARPAQDRADARLDRGHRRGPVRTARGAPVTGGLAVVETHPSQYHAPGHRVLQQQFGAPVTALYGSDFSLHPYRDREFGAELAWDVDLTSGFGHQFLSTTTPGETVDPVRLSAHGIGAALDRLRPDAVLVVGY